MNLNKSVNVNVILLLTSMFPIMSTQTRILSQNHYSILLRVKGIGVGTLKYQGETFVDMLSIKLISCRLFFICFHLWWCNVHSYLNYWSSSQYATNLEGVYDLLQNIQQRKASGPDNLPAWFLKDVAYEISPILSLLFRASLGQGMLPSIWKTAKVVPIFKNGNKSDPCNYRPVSITCICWNI